MGQRAPQEMERKHPDASKQEEQREEEQQTQLNLNHERSATQVHCISATLHVHLMLHQHCAD